MRIGAPFRYKKARIEIIPLIDIMFFLLASFIMVSLTMQHLMSIKVSLPTATQAKSRTKPDMMTLTVNRFGQVSLDDKPVTFAELARLIHAKIEANPNYPVYIQGHQDATHGEMVYVLDFVRRQGVQKVAFSVKVAQPSSP